MRCNVRINAGGLSDLIVGREVEQKTLSTYIKLGQHCAIVAPRRYGKTTLVNSVLNQLDKEKHLIVKLDVMSVSSIRELCIQMVDAVFASHGISNFFKNIKGNALEFLSRLKLDTEYISIGYDILKEPNDNEMLKQAFQLPEIFAQKYNKKTVVFIDEFGEMDKFGVDVIKKMRSYFQQHSHTVYIFAGSQTSMMNQIFLKKENAFFNFASIMRIGFIGIDDAQFFLKKLCIEGTTFSSDSILKILYISKGHPFYLIKILQESYVDFIIKGADKTQIIGVECVENGTAKIITDNNPLFTWEWERINRKKHKGRILKSLLNIDSGDNSHINASYKSQMIRELKDEAVLNDDKSLTDPLFTQWLLKTLLDSHY